MTSYTFDVPPEDESERQRRAFFNLADPTQESSRSERAKPERRATQPRSRVVTLRMPIEQIERLDHVAASAATCRGHLLRQIAADFLNYLSANNIQYRGSLLSYKPRSSDAE
jgi:hypothetical protein